MAVEHSREPLDAHAPSVLAVEEIDLQPVEEVFGSRVDGLQPFHNINLTSPLSAHIAVRSGQRW